MSQWLEEVLTAIGTYRYKPLQSDHIRLLHFSSSSTDYAINLNLEHVPIAEARYIALSYCWGDHTSTCPVTLNDRRFGSCEANHGLISKDLLMEFLKTVFNMMVISPSWYLECWTA